MNMQGSKWGGGACSDWRSILYLSLESFLAGTVLSVRELALVLLQYCPALVLSTGGGVSHRHKKLNSYLVVQLTLRFVACRVLSFRGLAAFCPSFVVPGALLPILCTITPQSTQSYFLPHHSMIQHCPSARGSLTEMGGCQCRANKPTSHPLKAKVRDRLEDSSSP